LLYLYLDESGDLGFDFVNKKPSKFFTVTIMVINKNNENVLLFKGVKKRSEPCGFFMLWLLPTRWMGTPKTTHIGLTAQHYYTLFISPVNR
jgi:hypothetical protein